MIKFLIFINKYMKENFVKKKKKSYNNQSDLSFKP